MLRKLKKYIHVYIFKNDKDMYLYTDIYTYPTIKEA